MSNKIIRLYLCFFTVLLLLSSGIVVFSSNFVSYNYPNDRIIITLSNEASLKLKDYTVNDFPELALTKVSDLTQSSKNMVKERNEKSNEFDGVSLNRFNQTLCLYLANPGYDNVINAIEVLKERKEVVAVSPDYFTEKYSFINPDTYLDNQWAINNAKFDDAWEITTGIGYSPVTIGVIDSGIQGNNPDLAPNIDTTFSADCTSDPIVLDSNPTDSDIHGTGVAGIIGAKGNNDLGIAGSIWYSKLISLKVNDPDTSISGGISSLIRSIDYATANNIDILNYCAGWIFGPNDDYTLNNPVEKLISNYPGLFVCAAGNHGMDYDNQSVYPACFHLPNMIVVGASDENNDKCSFSNYSQTKVDLFAPGTDIYTTSPNSVNCYPLSGTSMAAPFVTGVAALIKSIRPHYDAAKIKNLILNNVDTFSGLSDKCLTGGRLNAYKAVKSATERETFVADVDNDNYDDMILCGKNSNGKIVLSTLLGNSNGSFSNVQTFTSTKTFMYNNRVFCGDFNGDGKSDIMIHEVNNGYRQLLIYLGNSSGTFTECNVLLSSRFHYRYQYPAKFLVMDVNNDEKDDLVIVYKNSNGKIGVLTYKGCSTTPYVLDAATNALTSNIDYFDDSQIFSGDYNGDGFSDILVPTYNYNEKRIITIFKGISSGEFSEGQTLTSNKNHRPYLMPYDYLVGDYNGDGKTDFLNTYREVLNRKLLVYNGCNVSPYILEANYNNYTNNYNYSVNDYTFTGNVNGDDYDDLIVHYTNSAGKRCFRVYNGDSSSTFVTDNNTITTNAHNEKIYPTSFFVGDINNDGRCDMIAKWNDNDYSRFYVYRGKSDSTFLPAVSKSTSISFYN